MDEPTDQPARPALSRRVKRRSSALAFVVVALALGTAGGVGSYAAFSATSANTGNQVSSGTVKMSDNDGGTAAFTVSNLQPNSTQTRCIRVKSEGSFDSHVRTYATVAGSGLAPYVGVRITRGTQSSPSFPTCSGFTPDSTNYRKYGAGVVYAGTLADMPTAWANGIVDPPGTGGSETWTTDETHDYKIELLVGDNRAAETKNATATFTWEGRDGALDPGDPAEPDDPPGTPTSTYASTISGTSGLVGYWRLGETSGTSAADSSSNSNTGTYTSAYSQGAAGALTGDTNTATVFSRPTGYVNVPHASSLNVGDAMTLEAWVKRSSFAAAGSGDFHTILNKGDGGFNLSFTDTNQLRFTKPPSNPIVASTVSVADTNWHHIVATKSGATSKLYIDGVDRTGTVTNATMVNTTDPVSIGRRINFNQNFDGGLDEVALYNRALSASEVSAHYNSGVGN